MVITGVIVGNVAVVVVRGLGVQSVTDLPPQLKRYSQR